MTRRDRRRCGSLGPSRSRGEWGFRQPVVRAALHSRPTGSRRRIERCKQRGRRRRRHHTISPALSTSCGSRSARTSLPASPRSSSKSAGSPTARTPLFSPISSAGDARRRVQCLLRRHADRRPHQLDFERVVLVIVVRRARIGAAGDANAGFEGAANILRHRIAEPARLPHDEIGLRAVFEMREYARRGAQRRHEVDVALFEAARSLRRRAASRARSNRFPHAARS